jgi:guanylate kinase
MEKKFQVFTNSKELDEKSVNEFIEDAHTLFGNSYERIARYIYKNDNGRNIVIECEIPTAEIIEEDKESSYSIFLTAYEYYGEYDYEKYKANEIACEEFNGDWKSLEAFMRDMAEN